MTLNDNRLINFVCVRPLCRRGYPQEERLNMTASGFRKLALKMPEATEGSHFGNADFRIENKIFATLAYEKKGFGVLMLAPEQQQGMIADAPEIFVPVPNAWGKQGATMVKLSAVKPDILESALRTAWLRRAPKRLLDPKR